MSNDSQPGPLHQPEPDRGPFPFALVAGIAVVFVLVAALVWPSGMLLNPWFHGDQPSGAKRHRNASGAQLLFGPAEQAYAAQIHLENINMSRAENFLHQEVTTLAGEIVNTGNRTLQGVELTVEFSDELHQIVLRESRSVLDPPPLAPGARREFEISFEHVPDSWNLQQPAIAVTALRLIPVN
ncbi:MAG: FxLYD domain-containing protein [Candidatus Acidiferrum sp.]|jgi:hypothetical protein